MIQAPRWLLASHESDITFTIHKRIKIHALNQKKLKQYIKEEKKTNPSSRLLPPQNVKLWKNPLNLKLREFI